MIFVKQPQPSSCCGQACVAMIAGITLDDSMKIFGTKGGTYAKNVIFALQELNVPCGDKLIRISKHKNKSDFCIVLVHAKEDEKYLHWVVFENGTYHDPALGISSDVNGAYYNPLTDEWWEYDIERYETSFIPVFRGGDAAC